MREINKTCPDCGSKLQWYHNPGVSRSVCSKKCNGWKIIDEVDRPQRILSDPGEWENVNPDNAVSK